MAMDRTKVAKVEDVKLLRRGQSVSGQLHITPHHLIFQYIAPAPSNDSSPSVSSSSPSKQRPKELWVTYPIIQACTLRLTHPSSHVQPSIRLRGRDFNFVCFCFTTDKSARDTYDTIKAWTTKLGKIEKLYAFSYQPPKQEVAVDGWRLYDPKKEWARLGVGNTAQNWRVSSINTNYEFSPTYPALLPVPTSISDNTLRYAGQYRSRVRLPILTYIHPVNNCSITRGAQPMVGIRNNRSVQDEKLLAAIFNTTKSNGGAFSNGSVSRESSMLSSIESAGSGSEPTLQSATPEPGAEATGESAAVASDPVNDPYANPEAVEDELVGAAIETEDQQPKIYGAQQSNLIVDARPQINALAMQAAGMGSEHMENYPFASKVYLGIDNIHVMRDSLNRVVDAIKDSDLTSFPPNREALGKSNWIKHIGQVIEGTKIIVEKVAFHHSHVLIHCSDGWDRTSQLAALAQICLDPFYRTLDGFITLVEKDWLSFGYRFAHRAGFLSSEDWFKVENERISAGGESERQGGGARVTNAAGNALENAFLSAKGFFNKEQTKSRENLAAEAEADALDEVPSQRGTSIFGRKTVPKQEGETKVKEVSPIFHQFLDATYQILHRHPDRFEFNERFLRRLLYHLYSCQYGTFLYNNERERKEAKVDEKTASVWDYFLSRRQEFTNPKYDGGDIDDRTPGKERVLVPQREDTRWWNEVFGRTDQEMNGGQATLVSRPKERQLQTQSQSQGPTQLEVKGQPEVEAERLDSSAKPSPGPPIDGSEG